LTTGSDEGSTKRPPPITASRGRHAPDADQAPSRLTPKGEALSVLLPDVLTKYEVEIGADIDEVVCHAPASHIDAIAGILKSDERTSFKYLRLLCVVDYEEQEAAFDVVYHLYSLEHQHKMVLKGRVPASDPKLPTVTTVWRGADWYEREMHDLFGVEFLGHPDLRTLILPDGFEGYPGRKSYPLHDYDEF